MARDFFNPISHIPPWRKRILPGKDAEFFGGVFLQRWYFTVFIWFQDKWFSSHLIWGRGTHSGIKYKAAWRQAVSSCSYRSRSVHRPPPPPSLSTCFLPFTLFLCYCSGLGSMPEAGVGMEPVGAREKGKGGWGDGQMGREGGNRLWRASNRGRQVV